MAGLLSLLAVHSDDGQRAIVRPAGAYGAVGMDRRSRAQDHGGSTSLAL